ncbi:hypothetical protein ACOMHN_035989 [Nucella lapillus]
MLLVFLLFVFTAQAAAQTVGNVQVLGRVTTTLLDENLGLAASRAHPGYVYGHNDRGGGHQLSALDPATGALQAVLTIEGVVNHDWEDLCVGTCGGGEVRLRTCRWSEHDAESLLIDPAGDLYVISMVTAGDGLFAKLPGDGWGSVQGVPIGQSESVRLGLQTTHHDPRGADLSPDGRSLLVKTEESVLLYQFTNAKDYVAQLDHARPQQVSTYIRRPLGEAIAWNLDGTGFYTLPEGVTPVFHFYSVSRKPEDIVG